MTPDRHPYMLCGECDAFTKCDSNLACIPCKHRTLLLRGMLLLGLAITILSFGCASIWPDACKQDGRKITCDCDPYRIEDGPNKTIRQTCNGQPMPLTVRAKSVRVNHD